MQEGARQSNRDNLINFLDFAGEKGLMKKATATGYKKACNIILGIISDAEAADLSKINLEDVILRHRNLAAGRISPATLKTYEMRTRAAVNNFFEYIKNPSAWKPGIQQRPSRAKKPAPSARKSKESAEPGVGERPSSPRVHIDFHIHIAPEATPEQIDQIFASMSRHLYMKKTSQ